MASLERAVIRRADLGLFHGRETFDAYARYCRRPEVVHDIHISESDHLDAAALREKTAGATTGPLRICYVGRADAMKGPLDWVGVLERLRGAGVDFRAVWLGDGSQRPAMQARIAAVGLGERVSLPGFAEERGAVMTALRKAQVFLFCRKTPESPRCLIEALISGTPIVGYEGAFARDLIAAHGGGRLVPRDDVAGLAEVMRGLAENRGTLAALMGRAKADGAPFSAEAVFRHRSELIRTLPLPGRNNA
jgi:glycosyltransferase involved in cell wall biosynthesis